MSKSLLLLIGKFVSVCAFVFALMNANAVCTFIYHQPELPNKVKKLRRF